MYEDELELRAMAYERLHRAIDNADLTIEQIMNLANEIDSTSTQIPFAPAEGDTTEGPTRRPN